MLRIATVFFIYSIPLIFSNNANAQILYATISGTVTSLTDTAAIASENAININTSFNYIVQLDSDINGYTVNNTGDVFPKTDNLSSGQDYFYAKLISGSIIQEKDGGFFNAPQDIAQYNYALFNIPQTPFLPPNFSLLFSLGSDNNKIQLLCSVPINGDGIISPGSCGGSQKAFDNVGRATNLTISGDLEFSDTAPVPLHSTLLFLISSLFFIRNKTQ